MQHIIFIPQTYRPMVANFYTQSHNSTGTRDVPHPDFPNHTFSPSRSLAGNPVTRHSTTLLRQAQPPSTTEPVVPLAKVTKITAPGTFCGFLQSDPFTHYTPTHTQITHMRKHNPPQPERLRRSRHSQRGSVGPATAREAPSVPPQPERLRRSRHSQRGSVGPATAREAPSVPPQPERLRRSRHSQRGSVGPATAREAPSVPPQPERLRRSRHSQRGSVGPATAREAPSVPPQPERLRRSRHSQRGSVGPATAREAPSVPPQPERLRRSRHSQRGSVGPATAREAPSVPQPSRCPTHALTRQIQMARHPFFTIHVLSAYYVPDAGTTSRGETDKTLPGGAIAQYARTRPQGCTRRSHAQVAWRGAQKRLSSSSASCVASRDVERNRRMRARLRLRLRPREPFPAVDYISQKPLGQCCLDPEGPLHCVLKGSAAWVLYSQAGKKSELGS
uniref:serine/arginine repetitive matrix protein 1-like isoform X2 n=1 Tax=Macaca mulatta TaxID=9544 RepID=UPI0010A2734C|nr:serine/arginine repetitive matrix protein 1-like isoform X2 [Macaca mulatta]